jgi:hypothetical protein
MPAKKKLASKKGDWMLEALVAMATDPEYAVGTPVTLCVRGILVTGEIVSPKTWIDAVFDQAAAAFPPAYRDVVQEAVDDVKAKVPKISRKHTPYVHLKNATYAHNPPLRVPWARVLLASVDGWSLGRLADE